MKARKKPVEIEFLTFDDLFCLYHQYNLPFNIDTDLFEQNGDPITFKVETLTGTVIMDRNYHLIIGVHGELYPCKIDIFNETYDVVKE